MATATTSTLIALFESRAAAENAVTAMVNDGFPREDVSIVTRDSGAGDLPNIGPQGSLDTGSDAGTGAAIGGFAGFIGGVIALAIPGIGPIIAAGPLAAGIMGAGIGAASGGLIGALKDRGIPETDASRLSEAIRNGRAMLTAYVKSERADDVADFLDRHGAVHVDDPIEGVEPQNQPNRVRPLTPNASEAVRFTEDESLMAKTRDRERTQIYPGFTGFGQGTKT